MDKFEIFKLIIRECSYENTYKMAWARSLVELSAEKYSIELDTIEFGLNEIAKKYLKYYWDQTIFFDLIQGANPNKQPKIISYVKELIDLYKIYDNQPVLYERAYSRFEDYNLSKEYIKIVKKTVTVLKQDVSWRFRKVGKNEFLDLYKYHFKDDSLYIEAAFAKDLKDNDRDLYDLINYRWGLILETFNSSPRISKKVKIMDDQDINRNSLSKFKVYLDVANPEHRCFICGEKITKEDLSIDHVIPWSYMYSDDIWNLVYVHRQCNSRKNNVIPTETAINLLCERNDMLLMGLRNKHIKDKQLSELELAIDKDFVKKFWISCRM